MKKGALGVEAYADAVSVRACGLGLEQAAVLAGWLESAVALGLTLAQVEARVEVDGREVLRLLLQGHLDERARCERRISGVVDDAGVSRGRVERGHRRGLVTVFGRVGVERWAYRAPGVRNVYPADGVSNLPAGLYSFGVRRRMVEQVVSRSFAASVDAVAAGCGVWVGKRQAQEVTVAAAADIAAFYAARRVKPVDAAHPLVLTMDGKGVVMVPGSLRAKTARMAAGSAPKLLTRLSSGEKLGRKRMAQVGAVYDIEPVVRVPADVIGVPGQPSPPRRAGPRAVGKWLTASVVHGIPAATKAVFDQARRRDPRRRRRWVVLVDGNLQQIDQIRDESERRRLPVTIVIDFVHVLEYLWKAAHAFYRDGDPTAEVWVAEHARAILSGNTGQVIAAISAQAASDDVTASGRKLCATTVTYLTNKTPYLDYPTALAAGWPIATGVIEGACRYLVKDRMDITGARWGLTTAEAVLGLRALVTSGDLDDYWDYHLQQEHQRNHHSRYLNSRLPEPSSH